MIIKIDKDTKFGKYNLHLEDSNVDIEAIAIICMKVDVSEDIRNKYSDRIYDIFVHNGHMIIARYDHIKHNRVDVSIRFNEFRDRGIVTGAYVSGGVLLLKEDLKIDADILTLSEPIFVCEYDKRIRITIDEFINS